MKKSISAKFRNLNLPIFIEKDESGFYVVECPVLRGCYTQGKTLDEAATIKNTDISAELELPPVKIHCSILAEDAIQAAIADYKSKHTN